jgi:hypothetical protein
MIDDVTLQAMNDANQFIQQEKNQDQIEISGSVLSNRLYQLLLKNVSKDDPLTTDELQVCWLFSFVFLTFTLFLLGVEGLSR